MARRRMARFGLGVAVAAVVLSISASAALAGEVTGSGKNVDQNQGKSWCSFSGHNDDPGAPLDGSGPNGPGGQSQSFGQDVKLGLADLHGLFSPGMACNPTRTIFPPQPNRTH
jgi:opacity protein-like surface antigen